MNPIRALALTQAKTLIPNGMPIGGGRPLDKMVIAGAMAGLKNEPYYSALYRYCDHVELEPLLKEVLKRQALREMKEPISFTPETAENIIGAVFLHIKTPKYKFNKETNESELVRCSNYRIAIDSGMKRQSFTKSHESYYNTAYQIFQGWLNQAFWHIEKQLNDQGIE